MLPAGARANDSLDLLVDVATADPVSPPLLVAGTILLAFSAGVIGLLAAGAVLDALARPFE